MAFFLTDKANFPMLLPKKRGSLSLYHAYASSQKKGILSDRELLIDAHAERSRTTEDTEKNELLEGIAYSPISKIEKKYSIFHNQKFSIQKASLKFS